jgi:hypothetical protein
MQLRFTQYLNALHTAQKFLDINNAVLGDINSSIARQSLDTAIDAVEADAEVQEKAAFATRSALTTERQMAASLKLHFMKPIATIAQRKLPSQAAIKDIRVTPENASTGALVNRARVMASFVDDYPDVFTDLGVNLSQRVRTAADGVAEAILGKAHLRGARVEATEGILKSVAQARESISILNQLVASKFDGTGKTLKRWRNAVTVISNGVNSGAVPAPAPVPAAPPAAPTAATPEVTKAAA